MQIHLKSRGAVDDAGLERIEGEIREELRVAWDEAQKEPAPDPVSFFKHVHATPSSRLTRQLERFGRDGDA
jgi:TPP-dependent pyruvate/acetoin dehydrogenase alpha subunit